MRSATATPSSESCPLEVGDSIVLESTCGLAFSAEELERGVGTTTPVRTPVLWIEVREVRRTRKLQWRVLYRIIMAGRYHLLSCFTRAITQ